MNFLKSIYSFLLKKKKLVLLRSESGFTLIEVLVSMSIFILLSFSVYFFQKNIFSLNRNMIGGLSSQDDARYGLKIMTAEIRTASPSSLGAYPILQANTSSLIFYSNIDDDSFKERVRYFLDGNTLKKGVIKPADTPLTYNQANEQVFDLVKNVVNQGSAIFDYYDDSYAGTSSPLAYPLNISVVRLIKITVLIDNDPFSPPEPVILTTQISMRNLKDNL